MFSRVRSWIRSVSSFSRCDEAVRRAACDARVCDVSCAVVGTDQPVRGPVVVKVDPPAALTGGRERVYGMTGSGMGPDPVAGGYGGARGDSGRVEGRTGADVAAAWASSGWETEPGKYPKIPWNISSTDKHILGALDKTLSHRIYHQQTYIYWGRWTKPNSIGDINR